MRYLNQGLFVFIAFVVAVGLSACQAQGVRPLVSVAPDQDPDPVSAPLVDISFDGFDPETTTLRFTEGQTVTFEIDSVNSTITNASLARISGPPVDFGVMSSVGMESAEGDLMAGDGMDDIRFILNDVEGPRTAFFPRNRRLTVEFVMPSVTSRTTVTMQFRSSSPTQSRSRSIPIIIEDDASAITLSGKVSKGLVSNTKVRLYSVDGFLVDSLSQRQVVEPVQIDATGSYIFTLPPAIDFEELLLYKVKADGADMICDAPQGCRVAAFGESFEVDDDLDLRAYIPVPRLGSTQTVNINILTTLTARSAQNLRDGFEKVDPSDVGLGQRETADIFGLPNQGFTTLPFVDVTRPITSTNETAIRAAMIGGGILGAAFAHSDPDDNDDYLEELDDFIDDFGDGEVACRDLPSQTTLSFEDIMIHALDVARINGSAATQAFFSARLQGIRNGSIRCEFMPRVP